VREGRQIDEIVFHEVSLFVARPALVDEAFIHRHFRRTKNRRRTAPTNTVPGRLNGTPDAQSANKALETNFDVHWSVVKHVSLRHATRRELAEFVKGRVEVNLE
jgi:hypothetical protein